MDEVESTYLEVAVEAKRRESEGHVVTIYNRETDKIQCLSEILLEAAATYRAAKEKLNDEIY